MHAGMSTMTRGDHHNQRTLIYAQSIIMPSTANTPTNTTVQQESSSSSSFILSLRASLTAHYARAKRAALALDHRNAESPDVHICRVPNDTDGDGDGEFEYEPGLRVLAPVAAFAGGVADDDGESSCLALFRCRCRGRCRGISIRSNHVEWGLRERAAH